MKGGIYSNERCPICGSLYKHFEPAGLWCPKHPECRPSWFVVRFANLTRNVHSYGKAHRMLTGFRFKWDEGTYDERDYYKTEPLGFANLASKWLKYRKGEVRCYRNLKNHMVVASYFFKNINIKTVTFGDLEDFVHYLPKKLTAKTKANYLTTLHSFFVWVNKRDSRIGVPEFPVIKYELGWRNIVDKATQTAIIEEVRRISWDVNPKIWLGVKWLATYYEIRPLELINIKEKDIYYDLGTVTIRHTKTGQSRIVYFLDTDLQLAKGFSPAFPELYFFRHNKGYGGTAPGSQFGPRYLYKWWKRACKNLNIKGVDLYGGTRHSTVRHLRSIYSPEEIKEGGWRTNKAFERYLGPAQQERKRMIYREAAQTG